jgi:DNA polymerase III alpha subunit (gram-positive type)
MIKEILVLDIETTGLQTNEDLILELGMVKLDLETGEITTLFDAVFKDERLTARHREAWIFQNGFMTIDEIRNAKPITDYKEEIQSIMNEFLGRITAWNRDFDSAFLERAGFLLGQAIDCPMKKSVDYFKIESAFGYKWPKAQEAWDILFPNTPKTEEHRGLDDAKMEAAIIYELFKKGVYQPF